MKIQIVEDDKALSDGICMALRELTGWGSAQGGEASQFPGFVQSLTIGQAQDDFVKEEPQFLILDVNLPDGSGYEYLKWLRERSLVPVLILTANDMEMDEVMSLTLGADDYMAKPFSLAVLRARVQALARRASGSGGPQIYKEDGFVFDFERLKFTKNGTEVLLSVNEQKLLRLLIDNKERVLTRNILYDRIWSGGTFVDENALSVTVNRLRGKLEEKREGVKYIQTIYGQGYMWKRKQQ